MAAETAETFKLELDRYLEVLEIEGYSDMPGVGFIVWSVGLGSKDSEFKSHSDVELIPGGVDSACHPSEVGKMSASLLVSCGGVATRPGLCPIAKETA